MRKINNEGFQNVKDASSHEEHHDVSVADCLTNEGPIDLSCSIITMRIPPINH